MTSKSEEARPRTVLALLATPYAALSCDQTGPVDDFDPLGLLRSVMEHGYVVASLEGYGLTSHDELRRVHSAKIQDRPEERLVSWHVPLVDGNAATAPYNACALVWTGGVLVAYGRHVRDPRRPRSIDLSKRGLQAHEGVEMKCQVYCLGGEPSVDAVVAACVAQCPTLIEEGRLRLGRRV